MIKQNLHTHTYYCDGKDSVDKMVKTAVNKGFTVLGFSGHGNNEPIDECGMSKENLDKYIEDVLQAKEKYKDKIMVHLGIEEDMAGQKYDKKSGFEYIIGSVHYVCKDGNYYPVDYSLEVTKDFLRKVYNNDFLAYAKDYYQEVEKIAGRKEADIVGHVDLIMKYNQDEAMFSYEDPQYLKYAYQAIDKNIEAGKIFEINTGALSRGYRKEPYPHILLLKYIKEKGGRVLINTDCHNCENLDTGYEESVKLAKECGFKTLCAFENGQFIDRSIDDFLPK